MQSESENTIQAGSRVSLHFALALVGGEEIDSNFSGPAASFRIGDGSILPGFEEYLLGLRPGNELEVTVPAEQGFGEVNERNKQTFPVEKFQHVLEDDLVPTVVGSVVSFKDAGGFDIPGVVAALNDKTIVIDFNHPLAGKDIVFKAIIRAVLPSTVDVIEVKL
ncbi:MAG: FKBP-type peptidyl-prolyl cis-trans isomerase SlpA [Pseudohongiellaceae bacterium]|jgi:FKBP-type peptidyl-prolyl cis-trans isomerase SlpA